MRLRRNIYLVIGIVLIALNLLSDLLGSKEIISESGDTSFSLGYMIGSHIMLIVGLILTGFAYKIQKKIVLQRIHESPPPLVFLPPDRTPRLGL